MGKSDLLKDSMKSGLDGLLSSTKKSTSVRLKDSNPRLKDSRVQSFSRNADGQGVCGKNEGVEGFFKVFYTEYYERPYLTEKSKISS